MEMPEYNTEVTAEIETEFKKQHDMYVPAVGKADTVYGEILRAVGHLVRRHSNSGSDEFWINAESRSVGNFAGYLNLVRDISPALHNAVFYRLQGEKYGKFMLHLKALALQWMKKHENEPNKVDSATVEPFCDYNQCDDCQKYVLVRDLDGNGLGQHFCSNCANDRYHGKR